MYQANVVGFVGMGKLTSYQKVGVRYWLAWLKPKWAVHCAETDADEIFAIIAASTGTQVKGFPTGPVQSRFEEWKLAKPVATHIRNAALVRTCGVVIAAPEDSNSTYGNTWRIWSAAWQREHSKVLYLHPNGAVKTTFNPHTGEPCTSWNYLMSETGKGYVLDREESNA